jgi:hypothetical protein
MLHMGKYEKFELSIRELGVLQRHTLTTLLSSDTLSLREFHAASTCMRTQHGRLSATICVFS